MFFGCCCSSVVGLCAGYVELAACLMGKDRVRASRSIEPEPVEGELNADSKPPENSRRHQIR